MAKSKKKRRGKLLTVVLLVLLVLLLWQVWARGNFFEPAEDSTFSVTCDGKNVNYSTTLEIKLGVKYNFAVSDKTAVGDKNFTVKLVLHQRDVAVTIDGKSVKLSNLQDFTDDFVLDVTANGFAFCQAVPFSDFLSDKFGGKEVVVSTGDLFDLVVTSADGSVVVKIPLNFTNRGSNAEKITLNIPSIVF